MLEGAKHTNELLLKIRNSNIESKISIDDIDQYIYDLPDFKIIKTIGYNGYENKNYYLLCQMNVEPTDYLKTVISSNHLRRFSHIKVINGYDFMSYLDANSHVIKIDNIIALLERINKYLYLNDSFHNTCLDIIKCNYNVAKREHDLIIEYSYDEIDENKSKNESLIDFFFSLNLLEQMIFILGFIFIMFFGISLVSQLFPFTLFTEITSFITLILSGLCLFLVIVAMFLPIYENNKLFK